MLVHEQLGIYQARHPLPFKLNHVNCYAIKGKDGWYMVDTGLSNEAGRASWQNFFADHSIHISDIRGIYLTHFHPDHYGASGWLQQQSEAQVWIGEIDADRVERYWKHGDEILQAMHQMFTANGMPTEVTQPVIEAMAKLLPFTMPHAEVNTLQAGDSVQLGDYSYKVILTPGHTDGHICYYNEAHQVLLSGDHLLPGISSNISLWPESGSDRDPLDNFLTSLRSIQGLACELVLPAHGKPFNTMAERIGQLLEHHRERLALVRESTGREATAYQVCTRIFPQELSMHELRFAMAETLAHLMYLVYRGEVQLNQSDGVDIFSLV